MEGIGLSEEASVWRTPEICSSLNSNFERAAVWELRLMRRNDSFLCCSKVVEPVDVWYEPSTVTLRDSPACLYPDLNVSLQFRTTRDSE
jgi:hypothetical protein